MRKRLTVLILVAAMALQGEVLFKLQASGYAARLSGGMDQGGFQILPEIQAKQSVASLPLELIAIGNMYGTARSGVTSEADMDWYRAVLRAGGDRYDMKIGLQKINFGPARFLRVLQWFDTLNPLDPAGHSDGVKAGLLRFSPSNNLYIWAWGILPESERVWPEYSITDLDCLPTETSITRKGGIRIQFSKGVTEQALTVYHRRISLDRDREEIRYAYDIRGEYVLGYWVEAMQSRVPDLRGIAPEKSNAVTAGLDYTLPLGNGIYILAETTRRQQGNILLSDMIHYSPAMQQSVLMLSYPMGIFSSLMGLGSVDHLKGGASGTLIWQRTGDRIITQVLGSLMHSRDRDTFDKFIQIMAVLNL